MTSFDIEFSNDPIRSWWRCIDNENQIIKFNWFFFIYIVGLDNVSKYSTLQKLIQYPLRLIGEFQNQKTVCKFFWTYCYYTSMDSITYVFYEFPPMIYFLATIIFQCNINKTHYSSLIFSWQSSSEGIHRTCWVLTKSGIMVWGTTSQCNVRSVIGVIT